MRLLLVRHGRTRSDAEGRDPGTIDTPLDEVALAGVRVRFGTRRVVLVAHGFVAKAVRAICLGRADDWFRWQLDNAAVLDVQVPDVPPPRERLREQLLAAALAAAAAGPPPAPAHAPATAHDRVAHFRAGTPHGSSR